jgi:hypothetical protein
MNLIIVPISALCLFRGIRDSLALAVASGHMTGLLDSYDIEEESCADGLVHQNITYHKSVRGVLPGWIYNRVPEMFIVERFRQKTIFDEEGLVMSWEVVPSAGDQIFIVRGSTVFEDAPDYSARVAIDIDIVIREKTIPAFIQKILEKIVPALILADQKKLFHRLVSFLEKTSGSTDRHHRTSTRTRTE